jgi:hypothetical protein
MRKGPVEAVVLNPMGSSLFQRQGSKVFATLSIADIFIVFRLVIL